ncbi:MAG: hypothetical protein ACT4TC_00680 [Myxococcaceae bacterium]
MPIRDLPVLRDLRDLVFPPKPPPVVLEVGSEMKLGELKGVHVLPATETAEAVFEKGSVQFTRDDFSDSSLGSVVINDRSCGKWISPLLVREVLDKDLGAFKSISFPGDRTIERTTVDYNFANGTIHSDNGDWTIQGPPVEMVKDVELKDGTRLPPLPVPSGTGWGA